VSQYINLLGPAFRKQRLLLSLNRAALLLVITVLTMAGMMAYDRYRVDGLREELASAQGLLKAQNAYTSRLKGDGAQKGNITLDAEIQRLETELKSARDSMGVLEGGALGNRDGFARYMLAFSRQALDGLWLTGFSVGGSGEVAIRGRVVRPELVPAYIQRLNGEPALKGRAFAALEMHRPPPPAVAAEPGKESAQEKSAMPRFLEFALATAEPEAADPRGDKR
jgi:hypothetical protein